MTRKVRLSAVVLMAALSVLSVLLGPLASSASASVRPLQSSPAAGAYTALANPVRICDTRAAGAGGSVQNECTGKTLATGGTLDVALPSADVPAGATAVEVNVTVTNTAGTGFLNVYPTGSPSTTSVIDYTKGQTVANLVTVGIGTGSSITLANGPATGTGGATDAVVDVLGYYMPQPSPSSAGTYTALSSPARIADTRCSATPAPSFCASENLPTANATLATLGPAGTINVQATGVGGVPASGVAQVLVNLTIVKPSADTFLSAYATGQAAPTAGAEFSNLNAATGEIIAGKAIVDVNSSGQFTVFNHAGNADVVVDVEGYFASSSGAAGALFTPLASPVRVIGTLASGTTVAAGASTSATIAGANGVPAGATAAALDVIDIAPKLGNFLTVYPTSATPPVASDVNWIPANTYNVVPNAAFGTLSSTGSVSVYNGPPDTANNAGPTAVDADLFGYFSAPVVTPTALNIAVPSTTVNSFSVAAGATATVNATVTHGAGGPTVANDPVLFSVAPSAGATGTVCGTFTTPNPVKTNSSGVATVTYQAPAFSSSMASSCTVTALDGLFGQTGSGTIIQTAPTNTVSLVNSPPGPAVVPANGSSQLTFLAFVESPTFAPVPGDQVTFTTSGTPSAACGTVSPSSGTTTSVPIPVTTVYTASTTPGFCTLTATEKDTGSSASVIIDQTSSPAPARGSIAFSGGSITAVVPPFTATQSSGTAVTYTASVADASATPIPGDPVSFVTNGAAACGAVTAFSTTNASGAASFSYTAAAAGTCVITATDAQTNATQTLSITQSAPAPVVTVTPASTTVVIGTTDGLSVSVSNVVAADNGDAVTFSATPLSVGAVCGTATATTLTVAPGATTGTATSTYTAGTAAGFCTITASVAVQHPPAPVTPVTGTATVAQTA